MSAPGKLPLEITDRQQPADFPEPRDFLRPLEHGANEPFLEKVLQGFAIAPGKPPNALGEIFKGNYYGNPAANRLR